MTRRHIPELLAPVGGRQQLEAAVQNGADAVYMGGPLFNARIKAENFTYDDMRDAIKYAHERNVKVYITLNTLIKDSELEKAFSYISFLYGAGADAVILQDMGLARLIRKYLPDMTMHLSTQGTIYNGQAAGFVRKLGFSRVVPARELTLQEIKNLTSEFHRGETPCEVEVFVHGALCICYSGQCQMSRMLGGINGRSGNRGLCAQPCRLLYKDDRGRQRYLLSPKDICTLQDIPALCEVGVDSLKIEGRLKSPHYVSIVTAVYRKYLDMYRDKGYVKVDADDMHRLQQIFNRGGFMDGYLHGNPGAGLLSGNSPKNLGIYAGRVSKVKKGSTLVDIEPQGSLSIGDGIEIHSRTTTGNVLSYVKKLPDGNVRIGDIKGHVSAGDKVYKVTDRGLLKEAESTWTGREKVRIPVTMSFEAVLYKPPRLTVSELGSMYKVSVTGEAPVEKAVNRPLYHQRVKEQLKKLGDTPFETADISVSIDAEAALAVSVINSMRREAIEKLLQMKTCTGRIPLDDRTLKSICRQEKLGAEILESLSEAGKPMLYIYSSRTLETLDAAELVPDYEAVCAPIELYMNENSLSGRKCRELEESGVSVIPYVLNISKGALDKYIEDNFDAIVSKVKGTGILLGNPGWIIPFQEAGVKVYGDYGLNVYNRQSRMLFEEMGVEIRAYSHEAEKFFFGNIPLMITEHPVTTEMMEDRKGEKYTILRWHTGDKYLIFQNNAKNKRQEKALNFEEKQVHYRK